MSVVAALATVAMLAVAGGSAVAASSFPATIALPRGFQPEGIAIGPGTTFYVGSIPTGSVFRGDLRTGRGAVLVRRTGRNAIGVAVDNRNRLFVAGGPSGKAFVYNARTGADVATYTLGTPPATFINDVVVTRTGAYFTESNAQNAVLYRIPIGAGGRLGTDVQRIPLTGAIRYEAGFNANGIDATPNGQTLVIVQSNTGKLVRVNPTTGVTTEIRLRGNIEDVKRGDGILLDGRTLYVVQNTDSVVRVFAVPRNLSSARLITTLTDQQRLAVPTTIDDFGRRLYAVNARFGAESPSTTDYQVVQLRKPRGR